MSTTDIRSRLLEYIKFADEIKDEPDYFIIIDVRAGYKLLWTAFVIEYPHEKRKKQKEYEAWLKTQKSPGNA